jgi:mannose/fructose/N-acetylgalactosamine-specific phosphotransferase system component IID
MGLRARLWARGLLLQTCWNFERMQNIGLAYGLDPWLGLVYPAARARREALLRHCDFFNTNPYLEPMIVGMLCALEEEAAGLEGPAREQKFARLSALKKALASALAGIGDALFWQTLRPFAAAVSLLTAFWLWRLGLRPAVAAMAFFYLAVYNIPSVALRWKGLKWGYDWREQIAARLQGFSWQAWISRLRLAGTAVSVLLIVSLLAAVDGRSQKLLAVLALLAGPVVDRLYPRAVSAVGLYAGAGVLGTLAAAAGWI